MRFLYLLLIFILPTVVISKPKPKQFDLGPELLVAYDKVLNLEFEEATGLIEKYKKQHPNNVMPYFIENYIDLFTLFIGESTADFDRLLPNKEMRLDKLKQGTQDSPYYLYSQAELRLQWAMARIKFKGQYANAFLDTKKAFSLLEKNQRLFPDFLPNKRSLGVLHTIVGLIPDSYKWGVQLLGMNGTVKQGMAELKSVIDYSKVHYYPFEKETLVLYALLNLHAGNNKEAAWKVINTRKLNHFESPMACYIKSSVAMRTGRNDLAIDMLVNHPEGEQYYPFHQLDFLLGVALTAKLDPEAKVYLKKYVKEHKGGSYIKESYQKLAWLALVEGDEDGYYRYMELCKHKGAREMDEDKSAYNEAITGRKPQQDLLKVRLLYDGSYIDRAYELIKQIDYNVFNRVEHQIEYHYRYGRIVERQGKEKNLQLFYQKTIDMGAEEPYYYACNAAIRMGMFFEGKKDFEKAKFYYKKALSFSPNQYEDSLHARAKAGLNRIR